MQASILSEGLLSNLQLEAIVYGCQRHLEDLPTKPAEDIKVELKPLRAGFLLGDGAGMGKGRTLAGFVVENIARGRKRHIWISVSSDLYDGEQNVCRAFDDDGVIDTKTNRQYCIYHTCANLKLSSRCQA